MSINNKWEDQQYLNKGSYAKVFRVRMHGRDFALKKIYSHLIKDPIQREIVNREIMIMEQLDHPKIIKMYKAYVDQQQVSLLLQFAAGGSLYDQLNLYKKLPERQVKKYVKDIIQALDYLHNRQIPILHRDIKPQNLLIDAYGHCKLADFGSANMLDAQRKSYVGTFQYMAPQMQECQPHGIQIDVWTLGVLIYQLLTGEVPREIEDYPAFVSRPAEDAIKKLMNKDQTKRMTLQELKDHIWLSDSTDGVNSFLVQPSLTKLEIMNRRLQKFKHEKKSQNLQFSMGPKQKSQLQENQQVNKQAKAYVALLKERDRLKHQVLLNSRKIQSEQRRRMSERPYLLQQIDRVKKQIREYESNIHILRCKPLKTEAQCRLIINLLAKKVQQLKDFLKNLPQRTKSQLLQFSACEVPIQRLPLSQYIFRLKTQIIASRRDALIELRTGLKTRNDIVEMTQLLEQIDYPFQKKQSEIKLKQN